MKSIKVTEDVVEGLKKIGVNVLRIDEFVIPDEITSVIEYLGDDFGYGIVFNESRCLLHYNKNHGGIYGVKQRPAVEHDGGMRRNMIECPRDNLVGGDLVFFGEKPTYTNLRELENYGIVIDDEYIAHTEDGMGVVVSTAPWGIRYKLYVAGE